MQLTQESSESRLPAFAALWKRLTWPLGWRCEWYIVEESNTVVVRMGSMAPPAEQYDYVTSSASIMVSLTKTLPLRDVELMSEMAVLGWLYEIAHHRVEHELREWFRLDGVPVIEPHPEKWQRGVLGAEDSCPGVPHPSNIPVPLPMTRGHRERMEALHFREMERLLRMPPIASRNRSSSGS